MRRACPVSLKRAELDCPVYITFIRSYQIIFRESSKFKIKTLALEQNANVANKYEFDNNGCEVGTE